MDAARAQTLKSAFIALLFTIIPFASRAAAKAVQHDESGPEFFYQPRPFAFYISSRLSTAPQFTLKTIKDSDGSQLSAISRTSREAALEIGYGLPAHLSLFISENYRETTTVNEVAGFPAIETQSRGLTDPAAGLAFGPRIGWLGLFARVTAFSSPEKAKPSAARSSNGITLTFAGNEYSGGKSLRADLGVLLGSHFAFSGSYVANDDRISASQTTQLETVVHGGNITSGQMILFAALGDALVDLSAGYSHVDPTTFTTMGEATTTSSNWTKSAGAGLQFGHAVNLRAEYRLTLIPETAETFLDLPVHKPDVIAGEFALRLRVEL